MYKFKLFFPQSGNQTRRKKQILTIINYNVLNEQTSLMTMYNNNSNTYSSINNTVKSSNIYDSQSTTAKVTAITLGNVQRLGLSWQSGCFQYQRQEVRFQSSAKCYNEHISVSCSKTEVMKKRLGMAYFKNNNDNHNHNHQDNHKILIFDQNATYLSFANDILSQSSHLHGITISIIFYFAGGYFVNFWVGCLWSKEVILFLFRETFTVPSYTHARFEITQAGREE